MPKRKDPDFTVDQIEHLRHMCLNELVVDFSQCKCFHECCLLNAFEARMKKKLDDLMKAAKKYERTKRETK